MLLLPSLSWLLALLAVNSDALLLHYLFAASNCLQVRGGADPPDPPTGHPP